MMMEVSIHVMMALAREDAYRKIEIGDTERFNPCYDGVGS